jgi:hypothetical protein
VIGMLTRTTRDTRRNSRVCVTPASLHAIHARPQPTQTRVLVLFRGRAESSEPDAEGSAGGDGYGTRIFPGSPSASPDADAPPSRSGPRTWAWTTGSGATALHAAHDAHAHSPGPKYSFPYETVISSPARMSLDVSMPHALVRRKGLSCTQEPTSEHSKTQVVAVANDVYAEHTYPTVWSTRVVHEPCGTDEKPVGVSRTALFGTFPYDGKHVKLWPMLALAFPISGLAVTGACGGRESEIDAVGRHESIELLD